MARGIPAFWSLIAASPFVGGGYLLYTSAGAYPRDIGLAFAVFGVFIFLIGVYVHFFAAPSPPTFDEHEKKFDERSPTQRVAAVKIGVSLPFLVGGLYLLHFTIRPYIQPIALFFIGGYIGLNGVYTYWRNSLTKYYVTDQRIIRSYRFLSSVTREVPIDMVRGVSENKSITEMLVGLGNVSVSTGAGSELTVNFRNIEESDDVADIIRDQMQKYR